MNRSQCTLIAAIAAAAAAAPVRAQSMNVDFGDGAAAPPSSYAAAGQAGAWNAITAPADVAVPLVDLAGSPVAATVSYNFDVGYLAADDPGTSGDDQSLLDDGLGDMGDVVVTATFEGLSNGRYQVITYGWSPSHPADTTLVLVGDDINGGLIAGGPWPGGLQEGITHVTHQATVSDGTLTVGAVGGVWGHSGFLNGIQLVAADGAVINVPGDYPTIQAAVNAAADGDRVVIAPGVYSGVGNRDVDLLGKAITVGGSDPDDPAVVGATMLQCGQAGRGFILQSGETTATVIEGLTVTNAFSSAGSGAYLANGSGATFRNVVFLAGVTPDAAGVIHSDNFPNEAGDLIIEGCEITCNLGSGVATRSVGTLSISNTTILGNTGMGVRMFSFGSQQTLIDGADVTINGAGGLDLGGAQVTVLNSEISYNQGTGLAVEGAFGGESVEIANCAVTHNTAAVGTGGVDCHSDVDALVRNCLIAGNSGPTAGGLALSGFGAFTVRTSTIVGNTSTQFGGGGVRAFGTDPTLVTDSILWGNFADEGPQLLLDSGFNNPAVVTVEYTDLEGGEAAVSVEINCCDSSSLDFGAGNIDADPLFVNAAAGDYHLSRSSPAIDAGDPAFAALPGETDLDGDPRVVGGIVDLGADEHRRPGDLDADGTVGVVDLLILLGAWGPCPQGPCLADLDGDGAVGVTDLLALLADWG